MDEGEIRIQSCYNIFSKMSSFQQQQQSETCKETRKCGHIQVKNKKQPLETISKCLWMQSLTGKDFKAAIVNRFIQLRKPILNNKRKVEQNDSTNGISIRRQKFLLKRTKLEFWHRKVH